jgi:hypothetical protein
MSRMFLTTFAVLFLTQTGLSQTPAPSQVSTHLPAKTGDPVTCSLTTAQAPAIRGIKLGMKTEELLALFPGSSEDFDIKHALATAAGYPNYGYARVQFQQPSVAYAAVFKERFAGINFITVTIFDNLIVEFYVLYAGTYAQPAPVWPKLDDFVAKLSESFILPDAQYWQPNSDTSKSLKCNGFEIITSNVNWQGSILLRSTTYMDVKKERAAVDDEKRRREFKP